MQNAMAAEWRDRAMDGYRSALSDRKLINELVQGIGQRENLVLLVKAGAVTKSESDQIKARTRDDATRFMRAVEILKEKDRLECYIGFSRVVYYRNQYIGEQIFPLVKTVIPPEYHPPLVRTARAQSNVLPSAPNQPDVLWLCANEHLYHLATVEVGVSSYNELHYTPNNSFQYQALEMVEPRVIPTDNGLRCPIVWIMCPTHSSILTVTKIQGLLQHYNKISCLLLSAKNTSSPASQQGPYCIRVPKVKDKGCGFIAELRHMTALCEWGVCDRAPPPQQSTVSFCTLEDVSSLDASSLYEAAELVWRNHGIMTHHVAVLSDGVCTTCSDSGLHTVQYCNTIVQYLCKNIIWTHTSINSLK